MEVAKEIANVAAKLRHACKKYRRCLTKEINDDTQGSIGKLAMRGRWYRKQYVKA
jgi:hypothetical protein